MMKPSTLFLASISATTLVSGWHLQIYAAANYQDVIEDRSGTLTQPCKNLARGNVASSLHWYPGSLASEVILFDARDCKGNVLLDVNTETHISNFQSRGINDKAESYVIVL
ncbi:hypothetical protein F5882DRAFT_114899 [Hyaloscypha sp. PMI_1271]|nr:hypothetical protein F5882DRAFT_114899 [Hyaloscypha sp. PMI_1271]